MNRQLDKLQPTLHRAHEALREALGTWFDFLQTFGDFAQVVLSPEILEVSISDVQLKPAILNASPRVRHLAMHGKKRRTRKKNRNRALREYLRKETQP